MSARPSLTLKQIEIVRAVMVSGSIAGAARLLNVSQPGISRAMKHIETSLGIRLFNREAGRYVPAPEAGAVFAQIQEVHQRVSNLQEAVGRLERGKAVELRVGSVPSIAQSMMPPAIAAVRRRYADLRMNVEILKIEEAIDYILIGRGECVAMSYRLEHPSIRFDKLARGHLVCITPKDHPLAERKSVSAREIVAHPLIGIEPTDPYGRIMAAIFERESLPYDVIVKARFGSTVAALVAQGIGIAVLDVFTVADLPRDRLAVVSIAEDTDFDTFVASRAGAVLSSFAQRFVEELRRQMLRVAAAPVAEITGRYS
ncbi:LysR family transcriptional regulator [Jiella endophytica]|uniref:LysR family transcriptional regulator n=1 Tax=Jiella endophytica TaxID=2558362 RepID=A0A4Y8RQ09_9HYPH|nr:LysR substrate-binding domain-containing protein [Jiella endophytica]TFF24864.1 LysR family transcriptional regulator [Jiella endophytica]